jgi:hypothetical protein
MLATGVPKRVWHIFLPQATARRDKMSQLRCFFCRHGFLLAIQSAKFAKLFLILKTKPNFLITLL